jgi:predicted PolB exonuclease-like 3'-5' exonuclease
MIELQNILFIDIETVPIFPNYQELPEDWQKLWDKKAKYLTQENETPSDIYERAGIYAEFGKIICISAGIITSKQEIRIKSFYGDNEKEILNNFAELLNRYYKTDEHYLAAHNGKEFDYPYIARRMLVNKISLPKLLDIASKKPWEVKHIDTLELWKFGDYKHYTSLELLAKLFEIPTPKDDINGADVAKVYYQEKNIERIVKYCEKDVITLIKLYLRQKNIDFETFSWK